jgi:RHS repeat-associated protein
VTTRFLAIRDGRPAAVTSFTHDPDSRILTRHDDYVLRMFRYDAAGQLTGITRRNAPPAVEIPAALRRGPDREQEHEELHLVYDAVGNRTMLRHGGMETHYRYDDADQLVAAEAAGRHISYRYDSSGRLTEETEGERRQVIEYDGFGLPAATSQLTPERVHRARTVFNGNSLLASLVLTEEEPRREEERSASARYRWSDGTVPQILTQRASPELDDAERDRPHRLDADFSYGYGRTFAAFEHDGATFHIDALGSVVRTDETGPWAQATSYETFGAPEEPVPSGHAPGRPAHPGGERRHEELSGPELPRFGYRGELALGPLVYLRARTYDAALGRFTSRDPISVTPMPGQAVNPYTYALNDPMDVTDPLGKWPLPPFVSHLVHAAAHRVDVARHAVAHGFDMTRHTVAHGTTRRTTSRSRATRPRTTSPWPGTPSRTPSTSYGTPSRMPRQRPAISSPGSAIRWGTGSPSTDAASPRHSRSPRWSRSPR